MKSQVRIPSRQWQKQPLNQSLYAISRHLPPSLADDLRREVALAAGDIFLRLSVYDCLDTEIMAGVFYNADPRNMEAVPSSVWFDDSRQMMFHRLPKCGREQSGKKTLDAVFPVVIHLTFRCICIEMRDCRAYFPYNSVRILDAVLLIP